MDLHAIFPDIPPDRIDQVIHLLCKANPSFVLQAAQACLHSRLDHAGCFEAGATGSLDGIESQSSGGVQGGHHHHHQSSSRHHHHHHQACLAALLSLLTSPCQGPQHISHDALQHHLLTSLLPSLLASPAPLTTTFNTHPVANKLCASSASCCAHVAPPTPGLPHSSTHHEQARKHALGSPAPSSVAPAPSQVAPAPSSKPFDGPAAADYGLSHASGKGEEPGSLPWLVHSCITYARAPQAGVAANELTLGRAACLATLAHAMAELVELKKGSQGAADPEVDGILEEVVSFSADALMHWGPEPSKELSAVLLPAVLDAAAVLLLPQKYALASAQIVAALCLPFAHCTRCAAAPACSGLPASNATPTAEATPANAAVLATTVNGNPGPAAATVVARTTAAAGQYGLHSVVQHSSSCQGPSTQAPQAVQEERHQPLIRSCVEVSSTAVSNALTAACRLQRHVLAACDSEQACASAAPNHMGSSVRGLLHGLVLCGLAHRDNHARTRALHLLQLLIAAGRAPDGLLFGYQQWDAFSSIFQAQEEHVLHLVQPVWQASYKTLWEMPSQHPRGPAAQLSTPVPSTAGSSTAVSSTIMPSTAVPADAVPFSSVLAQRVVWVGLCILRRAASNSNVSIRSLGLTSFLAMPPWVLDSLAQDPACWAELEELLLQLLPAFENEKLVPAPLAPAATQGAKQGAADLGTGLTVFFERCLSALAKHQQHQQEQLCTRLVLLLLDQVGCIAQRATTASLLLQALASACESFNVSNATPPAVAQKAAGATLSPEAATLHASPPQQQQQPSGIGNPHNPQPPLQPLSPPCVPPSSRSAAEDLCCSSGLQPSTSSPVRFLPPLCLTRRHLQDHVQPLLQRIHFMRPAWQCAAVRAALLRIVAAAAAVPSTANDAGSVAAAAAIPANINDTGNVAAAGHGVRRDHGVVAAATRAAAEAERNGEGSDVSTGSIGFVDVLTLLAECSPQNAHLPPLLPLEPVGAGRALQGGEVLEAVLQAGPPFLAWLSTVLTSAPDQGTLPSGQSSSTPGQCALPPDPSRGKDEASSCVKLQSWLQDCLQYESASTAASLSAAAPAAIAAAAPAATTLRSGATPPGAPHVAPACDVQLSRVRVLCSLLPHLSPKCPEAVAWTLKRVCSLDTSLPPSSACHANTSSSSSNSVCAGGSNCMSSTPRISHSAASLLACLCACVLGTEGSDARATHSLHSSDVQHAQLQGSDQQQQQQQQQDCHDPQQRDEDQQLQGLKDLVLQCLLPLLLRHHTEVCLTHSLWDPQWCAWLKASVWTALEHEGRHAALCTLGKESSLTPCSTLGHEGRQPACHKPTPSNSNVEPISAASHFTPGCSTCQPSSGTSKCWSVAEELSSWLPRMQHQLSQACTQAPGTTSFAANSCPASASASSPTTCPGFEADHLPHMALLLSTAELCFAGLQQQQQQQQQQRIQQDQHPYLTAKDHVNNPHVAAAAPSAAAAAAAAGTAWPIQALSQLCDLTPPDGGPPSSGDAHSTADSCAQLRLHCMAQLATIAGDAASSYATSSDANAALSNAASTSTNAASSSANASAVPSQYYAVRQRVFRSCVDELQWAGASAGGLEALLAVLLATAPFDVLLSSMQPQQPQQQQQQQQQFEGVMTQQQQQEQAVEDLSQLLQQLPCLTSSNTRRALSEGALACVVRLFFHPVCIRHRALRRLVDEKLIPLVLTHGGAKMAVALMSHLCQQVLLPGSEILHHHLPHITHLLAFSLFSEAPPSSAAAAQAMRIDPSVTLPPRVVLCGHLSSMARNGADPCFIASLISGLLAVANGSTARLAGVAAGYEWLHAREAGQASVSNAIKVSVWQALCLLAPHIQTDMHAQVLDQVWACLLTAHLHGNVRPFCQLFIVALLAQSAAGVSSHLLPALSDYDSPSYQVSVSVILVALYYLLHTGPSSPHFVTLIQALLPWSLHHRHAVRVPTQVLLHYVFERHMGTLAEKLGPVNVTVLVEVQRFLSQNSELSQIRDRQSLCHIQGFSLEHETSLSGVFGINPAHVEALCDGETDAKGLLWHVHARDRLPMDILSQLPGAMKAVSRSACSGGSKAVAAGGDDDDLPESGGEASGPSFQQFRPQISQAMPSDAPLSLLHDGVSDGLEQLVQARKVQQGLVVVASLLDNVPNQAGLCRTCESLSVEALVLPNKAVVATDAFKKQSVTSERWLRLLEVSPRDVATFLQERKACGYTIIGIEQATNSVPLQSYAFPHAAVVLLGNEQSGIPAPLLHLLDVCVEIPTLGVTRSMNAHVCGALVTWQYTQQRITHGR